MAVVGWVALGVVAVVVLARSGGRSPIYPGCQALHEDSPHVTESEAQLRPEF